MTEGDSEVELDKSERAAVTVPEDRPAAKAGGRVAVFDLPSLFWTVAKAREGRDKGPSGAALAALRHARDLAGRLGCDAAVFAHERRPYWREAASVQGVRCVPERREVEGGKAFDGWKTTDPLIPYKADRAKKDPALVEELAALSAALSASGFGVFVVEEGRPYDPDEPEGGQGSSGPRATYFEADEVAASLARRIAIANRCAVVVSNDFDLAQVLSLPEAAEGRVLLARVSGGDAFRYVTAEEVRRDYGVPPGKLADFLALAGDGDFKPYPGADRGAARRGAGIGEAAAREVLAVFGGFEAAVACSAAVAPADASKMLLRALALLKAGGRERAECALQLARLRFDVPIDGGLLADLGGDWTAAEIALKTSAATLRAASAPPHIEAPPASAGLSGDEASRERIRAELLPRLAIPTLAQREGLGGADIAYDLTPHLKGEEVERLRASAMNPRAMTLAEMVFAREVGIWRAPILGLTIPVAGDRTEPSRVTAREIADAIDQGLVLGAEGSPRPGPATALALAAEGAVLLVLTEAEFWALAALPAALDAGLLAPPLSQVAAPVVLALRAGLVEYATAGVLVGKVSREVVEAVEQLSSAALAAQTMSSATPEFTAALARALRVVPHYGDLVGYGGPLRRI